MIIIPGEEPSDEFSVYELIGKECNIFLWNTCYSRYIGFIPGYFRKNL